MYGLVPFAPIIVKVRKIARAIGGLIGHESFHFIHKAGFLVLFVEDCKAVTHHPKDSLLHISDSVEYL